MTVHFSIRGGRSGDSSKIVFNNTMTVRIAASPLPPVTNKHYVIPNEVRDLHPLKRILAANLNDMDEKFG